MYRRIISAVVLTLGLALPMMVAADEKTNYREGIAAFKQADYLTARKRFKEAEDAGMDTVSLYYNLGATHYRLNDYRGAASYFGKINNDPKWGALAEYNLGLIAEHYEDFDKAAQHYQNAYNKSDSEKIRTMAQMRLSAVTGSASASHSGGWTTYLSGAVGNDDNPSLLNEAQSSGVRADTFAELIGNVSGYLNGQRDSGVRLSGGVYSRQYNEMIQFSVTGINTGLFLDKKRGSWRFVHGVQANNFWVDSSQYSAGGSLLLHATRQYKSFDVNIRNDLGYIIGGSGFEYITGLRNRLSLDLARRQGGFEWRVGYRHEYNGRNDLITDDEQFFSYSPIRHSVYSQLHKSLGEHWSLRARMEYRHSQYADDNRELDPESGTVTEIRRKEDRTDFSALLRYSFNQPFSVFSEYRYTSNASNLDRFTYQSNQVMLGVDMVF